MYVFFWDIDGTLLSTARAGVFALVAAAQELCDVEPDLDALPTSGLTDAEVARLVLVSCGGEGDDATVQRFLRAYERALPECLGRREGHVMPGVREILEAFESRDDVTSLLLTGNTEAGAAAKLRHYDLDRYFPDGGSFCIDGGERAEIARRAVAMAGERLDAELDLSRTFVIGDTRHDIACGKAIGARTVAVAFTQPAEELRAEDPWLLLDAFPEPEQFARSLGLAPAYST